MKVKLFLFFSILFAVAIFTKKITSKKLLGAGNNNVKDKDKEKDPKTKIKKHDKKLPGHIVILGPFVSDKDVDEMIHTYLNGNVKHKYKKAIKGWFAELTEDQINKLILDPRVLIVEENSEVELYQWGLDRIDQRDLPLSNSYSSFNDGLGVHAYVIDTGIRATHTDFGGRIGNGVSMISDGNGTNDCHGHGTHVSGTIGGKSYGVAKKVTLHPVRVFNCAGLGGSTENVVQAIDWVRTNHIKPAVINMSLGGGVSPSMDSAVSNAVNAGITVVVAAGNSNQNACNFSPAREPSAITVGSTNSGDSRSYYSNFGTCVDIFAPGEGILSDGISSDSATATLSGTSMASPHVAGIVALYLQSYPTSSPAAVLEAIRTASVSNKVVNPGSGSPNILAQSLLFEVEPNCILLYSDCLFAGASRKICGVWSGEIDQYTSSIRVGSRMTARFFDITGRQLDLGPGTDAKCLIDYNYNDVVKTLHLIPIASPGCAMIFEHCWFFGNVKEYCADVADLHTFNFNDIVSSAVAGWGVNLTLYQHGNYQGDNLLVHSFSVDDASCFDWYQHAFNDQSTSLKLTRIT
jgi:subtilisin family serine protease